MNITLAIIIYLCIYTSINHYYTTKISADSPEEFLTQYGLVVGDEIYKVDGQKVLNASDVERIILNSDEDLFEFELIRNNEHVNKNVLIESKTIGYIGVAFSDLTVVDVSKADRGYEAGIKTGDILLDVNGEKLETINDYLKVIKANAEKPITMRFLRGEDEVEISITPSSVTRRTFNVSYIEVQDLDFGHNLLYAWKETKYYIKANVLGIFELISGRAKNVELQGIVGVSKQISSTQSLIEFFYLMSAVSLSLGIMNLLPIPGLDGGKLLLVIVEGIRGKPLNRELEAKITLAGFLFLIALMIYVTIGDISKLI